MSAERYTNREVFSPDDEDILVGDYFSGEFEDVDGGYVCHAVYRRALSGRVCLICETDYKHALRIAFLLNSTFARENKLS